MSGNRFDLHNTADKDDELTAEQVRKLITWWVEQALPRLEERLEDADEP